MEKPKVAATKPFVMKVEPGTYAWCACGHSKNQPFCDGSHKPTPYKPVIEKVEKEKNVAWCGCKQTGSPPFCDGSHNKLQG
jgi:CDGSH iron-sulfur domain-containing protein 3